MNIEEVFNAYPSINEKEFRKVFQDSNLKINKNYLLLRKFKKILGNESIPLAIMRSSPDCHIEFSLDDVKLIIDGTFHSEKFARKDLLNFLLNFDTNFIEPILDSNIFDKIYIIDSYKEYERDALNLKYGNPVSLMLLQRKDLKAEIIIKKLVNRDGEIHPEYLDHLGRCLNLIDEKENTKTKKGLDFILTLEWNYLNKVTKRFNLGKYVIRFAHFDENLSMADIERLFLIKGSILDLDMFYIIYNNYYLLDDKNNLWLLNVLSDKEISYTNYEIASWVCFNEDIYWKYYQKIDQFHKYSFPDQKICNLFMKMSFFIPKLAVPEHINKFILDNFEKYKDTQPKNIAKFLDYSLRKCTDPSFNILANAPEQVLLKLEKIHKLISADVDKDKEVTITFLSKYRIKTKIEELLTTTNWFDFPNFHDQFMEGRIPITDVYLLKFKNKDELFRSKLVNMPCGICLKMVENTFIFAECSHSICLACCKNYLKTTLKINFKKEKNENRVIFSLERSNSSKVKCPTCKKEVEKNDKVIIMRVFI